MQARVLAALNILVLILAALGCYAVFFSLDKSLTITEQMNEARIAAMLLLALHAFMFGMVTPPITTYLLDAAEARQLWDYDKDGVHVSWYGVCLGVGVLALLMLARDFWPTVIAPRLGLDGGFTPAFLSGGLLLTLGCATLGIGKLPPNGVMGYRLPKTLSSPSYWQRLHSAAQRYVPLPAFIAGAIMLCLPDSPTLTWVSLAVFLALIALPLFLTKSGES